MKLLPRAEFREAVMALSDHTCCVPGCNLPAEDAHHIIERRLWPDGGYYVENGAAVCDLNGTGHHRDCESNLILPDQLREWCGIVEVALPPDWDDTLTYNKWGDVVNWNGKYPRTFHLPNSLTKYKDDKTLKSLEHLTGELIVTEKMDGENTTMSNSKIHARSVDSASHDSQSWVRSMWSKIQYDIPEGFRLCGENMYAMHSVYYDNLPSYFFLFGVWDNTTLLSWDETVEWAELFGLETPKVFYRGTSLKDAMNSWDLDEEQSEGYVVRVAGRIPLRMFSRSVGKFVRANHVRTLDHGWRFRNDYRINLTKKGP